MRCNWDAGTFPEGRERHVQVSSHLAGVWGHLTAIHICPVRGCPWGRDRRETLRDVQSPSHLSNKIGDGRGETQGKKSYRGVYIEGEGGEGGVLWCPGDWTSCGVSPRPLLHRSIRFRSPVRVMSLSASTCLFRTTLPLSGYTLSASTPCPFVPQPERPVKPPPRPSRCFPAALVSVVPCFNDLARPL